MNAILRRVAGLLTIAYLAGCGGGSTTPTTSTSPTTAATPTPTINPSTLFRVAVLIGTSRPAAPADITRTFAKADELLFLKTGQHMTMVDMAAAVGENPTVQAFAYINAHASSPPDGILVMADDSTTLGGYSFVLPLPGTLQNRFPSPVANVGANKVYAASIDFQHLYSRCGYDDAGNRVRTVSANGECRNRAGMVCVNNGRYWTCPDSLNDLYAQPDGYMAATFVHEFMHPFGSEGAFDHWGSPQCTARTAMSAADVDNLNLAQQNYAMCPDLYPRFRPK